METAGDVGGDAASGGRRTAAVPRPPPKRGPQSIRPGSSRPGVALVQRDEQRQQQVGQRVSEQQTRAAAEVARRRESRIQAERQKREQMERVREASAMHRDEKRRQTEAAQKQVSQREEQRVQRIVELENARRRRAAKHAQELAKQQQQQQLHGTRRVGAPRARLLRSAGATSSAPSIRGDRPVSRLRRAEQETERRSMVELNAKRRANIQRRQEKLRLERQQKRQAEIAELQERKRREMELEERKLRLRQRIQDEMEREKREERQARQHRMHLEAQREAALAAIEEARIARTMEYVEQVRAKHEQKQAEAQENFQISLSEMAKIKLSTMVSLQTNDEQEEAEIKRLADVKESVVVEKHHNPMLQPELEADRQSRLQARLEAREKALFSYLEKLRDPSKRGQSAMARAVGRTGMTEEQLAEAKQRIKRRHAEAAARAELWERLEEKRAASLLAKGKLSAAA